MLPKLQNRLYSADSIFTPIVGRFVAAKTLNRLDKKSPPLKKAA
jgi:hypothetical protein